MKKTMFLTVLLAFVNISLAADNCTKEFNPVCDTEGKMHANECVLKGEGAELDPTYKYVDNKCVKTEIVCTKEFNPVCSTKGVMYGNKCELESKWAVLDDSYEVINNQCVKAEINCTEEYAPVCGVDGKVYDNKCLAKAEGVELDDTKYSNYKRECASISESIEGERKLISFNGDKVNQSISVKFDGNNMSSEMCNHVGGEYTLKGTTITAPFMFRTEMFCFDESLMKIEDNFQLDGASISFGKSENSKTLTIESANGSEYTFESNENKSETIIGKMLNKYFEKNQKKYQTANSKKEFTNNFYKIFEKNSNKNNKHAESYKKLLDQIKEYENSIE